jgi:pentatricopeptide repeat protein
LGRTDKIQQALEFFEMMKKQGIHPNERTYSTQFIKYFIVFKLSFTGKDILMKIYCKCGKSAEALEILEMMKEEMIRPNEITYHVAAMSENEGREVRGKKT